MATLLKTGEMASPSVLFVVSFMLLSCGPDHAVHRPGSFRVNSEDLSILLKKGRIFAVADAVRANETLRLADDNSDCMILETQKDMATGKILREIYSNTKMPPLHEAYVPNYLKGFFDKRSSEFGITGDELYPSENFTVRHSSTLVSFFLDRKFKGIPVRNAFIEAVFQIDDNGMLHLREILNRSYGKIGTEPDQTDSALLMTDVDFSDDLGQVSALARRRVILPILKGPNTYEF
ncbi:MAG: hypothetical protein HQK54_15190, partial [Oligoflexales bacterium]|nr:hypothetical protein [Oligoflexales bacterium]